MKTDIIIIGSGLFGSVTAKHLRSKGLEVVIIDNVEHLAASKCCMGIWKEGWVNKAIAEEVEDGMALLDKYCGGIRDEEIYNLDKDEMEIFKLADCSQLLNEEFIKGEVNNITNNVVQYVENDSERTLKAGKAVIIAAGAWTGDLLTKCGYDDGKVVLDRLWGANFTVNLKVDCSRISQWAPYKQNVLFKLNDKQFMFGDGATVKNPVMGNDKRLDRVNKRLLRHLKETAFTNIDQSKMKVNEGVRPYIGKGGSGKFINKHDDVLFSATGGAKNSCILCGHIAKQLWRKIKKL